MAEAGTVTLEWFEKAMDAHGSLEALQVSMASAGAFSDVQIYTNGAVEADGKMLGQMHLAFVCALTEACHGK